jgi:hypothetical protein
MLVKTAAVLVSLPTLITSQFSSSHSLALLAQIGAFARPARSRLVAAFGILWQDLQEAGLGNCIAVLAIVHSLSEARAIRQAGWEGAFGALEATSVRLSTTARRFSYGGRYGSFAVDSGRRHGLPTADTVGGINRRDGQGVGMRSGVHLVHIAG